MKRGPFLFVLAALALAPLQAAAQSQWEQQVLEQIRTASELFAPEGYAMVGDAQMGSLHDESSEDFYVTLQAGVAYVLVGVCDNDCPDVDLMLLDDSGNEIDSDYETDAVPIVEVTPFRTQSYQVHVYMADCTSEPCFYGVGVYADAAAASTVQGSMPSTQNYRGQLDTGDDRLDGDYYDTYDFYGNAGDTVVIDLFSSSFDTYLILMAPSGADTQNDDYNESLDRSRIERVLDETGTWTAFVTSYESGETGAYELSITTASSGSPVSKRGG
jgi:hypothetical protein